MTSPKVFIACPTYEGKDYALEGYLDCIERVLDTLDGARSVIVDNSKNRHYYRSCQTTYRKKYRSEFFHVPRGSNSRDAICNSMNYARELFLQSDADYFLVIEVDLRPTPDVFWTLHKHIKPVVGALYFIGFENDPTMPRHPCLFTFEMKPEVGIGGTRIITPKELPEWYHTGLRAIHGMGLGCTLIRRDIVERFPFWVSPRFDNKHHDVYFYMDCWNNHIPVFCDTDYVVKHENSRWSLVTDK